MHLPANTFSARHESRGEQTGTSTGTTITNGSGGAKGTWAALGSATTFAYEGITVYFAHNANPVNYVVDIGIDDGAGNNFVLVADLSYSAQKQANEHNLAISIPVHVPAGALLEARASGNVSSEPFRCLIVGHSANPGGFPGYSRAVALFTPSSSRGVAVDPGTTGSTNGAWTQLTASSSQAVAAIFGVVGFNGDVARAAAASMNLQIGVGASSSEQSLIEGLCFSWGATWDGPNDVFFQPIACSISLGTRVVARARCNHNTAGDRTVDLALYGLVH